MEKENAALTEHNYRLVSMCHERDEQLLHSGALQAMVKLFLSLAFTNKFILFFRAFPIT